MRERARFRVESLGGESSTGAGAFTHLLGYVVGKQGWFKLHRKAIDGWLWTLPAPHFKVALTVLAMANWKEGSFMSRSGQQVTVPRGSCISSSEHIAKAARVGRQVVRTALRHLENVQFLTKTSTNHFTMITIVNYERYQNDDSDDNQEPNQHLTSTQPAPNQHLTTIEEEKKEKKVRNSFDFDAVYQSYPRKVGKKPGLAKLRSLVKEQADYDLLVKAVRTMATAWQGQDLKYCPHFSTFVSQERWRDDDLPLPSKGSRDSAPALPWLEVER